MHCSEKGGTEDVREKGGQSDSSRQESQGQNVGLWDRNAQKRQFLRKQGVQMEGACPGTYRPVIFDEIEQICEQVDILLVMTTADGHLPIAQKLSGHLRVNQTVLILNGNLGAWESYCALRQEVQEKNVVIAETGGMILLCDYNERGCFGRVSNGIAYSTVDQTLRGR